jgi:uncharacterized protein YjiS (DUF1127 family)
MRRLATAVRALALAGDRLTRAVLTAAYRRGAVRALQRLGDSALADMGVPRCEIESAVQLGMTAHALRKIEYRQQKRRRGTVECKGGPWQKTPRTLVSRAIEPAA